jgi:hypothetical protein
LMPSWWWWIDLVRWHTSFPPRIMPWLKRQEGCSSHTCSNIMASQRPLCRIEIQSSQASYLVSLVEAHGVRAQDEHCIPTPNGWTNREGELGYPTIPKELCGNGSTRLGGPFGVGQILLQLFGAFGNEGHPLSNGDGQVTNCAHHVGHTWTTPKWCKWGSVNGHTTWWRKVALVGVGQY